MLPNAGSFFKTRFLILSCIWTSPVFFSTYISLNANFFFKIQKLWKQAEMNIKINDHKSCKDKCMAERHEQVQLWSVQLTVNNSKTYSAKYSILFFSRYLKTLVLGSLRILLRLLTMAITTLYYHFYFQTFCFQKKHSSL